MTSITFLAVMWVATTYMASISVAEEVKWCWFILSLAGLTGYVLTLVRTYKVAAEARSEGVSQVLLCFA
jgi:H+/Cl- antiporter ClcA